MAKAIKKVTKKTTKKAKSKSSRLRSLTSIIFSTEFKDQDGVGYLEIFIKLNGEQQGNTIKFEQSGTASRTLGPGNYLIYIEGVTPNGEAVFNIDRTTIPATPKTFNHEPITGAFLLQL